MTFKFATVAAAIIGSVSVAQAADLGKPAPAAVDYVKVCDAYGAGFFYIPGGETCLKIDGYVRADFRIGDTDQFYFKKTQPGTVDANGRFTPTKGSVPVTVSSGFVGPYNMDDNLPTANAWYSRARALMHLDARTNTEFGLLRSYIEVYWTTNTGDAGSVSTTLDQAFVQWGGLTAGRTASVFDYFTGYAYGMNFGDMASDVKTNLLAYTLSAGNGISATIAIEDATTNGSRRRGGATELALKPTDGFTYGGNQLPDFVGNIMIAQAWGTAKLSGALHHLQSNSAAVGDEWGYAVQAAVEVNIPQIGAGTKIAAQVAYAEGALSYASGNFVTVPNTGVGADAVVFNGDIKKATAWSSMLGLTTKITPVVQFDLHGGYGSVDGFGARDFDQLEIAGDIRYTAAPGLVIGIGLEYKDLSFSSATKRNFNVFSVTPAKADKDPVAATKTTQGLSDGSAWVAAIRVQRNF
jgi:hypothetical protein